MIDLKYFEVTCGRWFYSSHLALIWTKVTDQSEKLLEFSIASVNTSRKIYLANLLDPSLNLTEQDRIDFYTIVHKAVGGSAPGFDKRDNLAIALGKEFDPLMLEHGFKKRRARRYHRISGSVGQFINFAYSSHGHGYVKPHIYLSSLAAVDFPAMFVQAPQLPVGLQTSWHAEVEETAGKILVYFQETGLPWLNRHAGPDGFLNALFNKQEAPTYSCLFAAGICQAKLGRFDEAMQTLERAIGCYQQRIDYLTSSQKVFRPGTKYYRERDRQVVKAEEDKGRVEAMVSVVKTGTPQSMVDRLIELNKNGHGIK